MCVLNEIINQNKNNYNLFTVTIESSRCSRIELWHLGADEFFKGILSCCLIVEDLLQDVAEMLEK